ncbi:hypothetical protein FIBSPDRAFT_990569 [Athelia psychrophila]|uniref:Uncharacterized protein n=1 Tax=Athelia psychrophila TaxID=1759441 RepID=A0A166S9W8_9AGAM|nr:hypothetical protein FIBSPDRAFT_990569 [Fibularhizoctonia sp. CBS 109695]
MSEVSLSTITSYSLINIPIARCIDPKSALVSPYMVWLSATAHYKKGGGWYRAIGSTHHYGYLSSTLTWFLMLNLSFFEVGRKVFLSENSGLVDAQTPQLKVAMIETSGSSSERIALASIWPVLIGEIADHEGWTLQGFRKYLRHRFLSHASTPLLLHPITIVSSSMGCCSEEARDGDDEVDENDTGHPDDAMTVLAVLGDKGDCIKLNPDGMCLTHTALSHIILESRPQLGCNDDGVAGVCHALATPVILHL